MLDTHHIYDFDILLYSCNVFENLSNAWRSMFSRCVKEKYLWR